MNQLKFVLIGSALMVGAASQAAIVYDTFTPATGFTFYTGPGNLLSGDNMALPDAGAGMHWQITGFTATAFASDAGDYSDLHVDASFFNGVGVGSDPADPAFTDLAGSAGVDLSDFTATGAGSGISYTVTGLAIDLADTPTVPGNGFGLQIAWSSTGPGTLSSGYADIGSSVAGSAWSNGMFVDVDDTGQLTNSNFVNFSGWTNGNLAVQITAEAVPEPASMAVLAIGALALVRRRKKA